MCRLLTNLTEKGYGTLIDNVKVTTDLGPSSSCLDVNDVGG